MNVSFPREEKRRLRGELSSLIILIVDGEETDRYLCKQLRSIKLNMRYVKSNSSVFDVQREKAIKSGFLVFSMSVNRAALLRIYRHFLSIVPPGHVLLKYICAHSGIYYLLAGVHRTISRYAAGKIPSSCRVMIISRKKSPGIPAAAN